MEMKKAELSPEQAEIFEALKERDRNFSASDGGGCYFTFVSYQNLIIAKFPHIDDFFQAWLCGYTVYDPDQPLSLF